MTDLSETWTGGVIWDDGGLWSDGTIVASILPATATDFERSVDLASARIQTFPDLIRPIWDAETCPPELLPWLAWAFSVDDWSSSWSDETKREVIRQSVSIHRRKGTVGAIKDAIRAAGLGNAVLRERGGAVYLDGARDLDGSWTLSPGWEWAEYGVTMDRPITNAQAEIVRQIIASVAPLRCHLKELNFTEAAKLLDGTWRLNGEYNLGVA